MSNTQVLTIHDEIWNISDQCELRKNGLILKDGVTFEEWSQIGEKIIGMVGSGQWALGDWLAYGQEHYKDTLWNKRVPNQLYEKISEQIGYAISTLKNAKWVCLHVDWSLRRDFLTFSHAMVLCGGVNKNAFEYWIDKLGKEKWSVKEFRKQLKRASSTEPLEPNDRGEKTFLEKCRQFSRDFISESKKATEIELKEAAKILLPVFKQLSQEA